MKYLLSLIPYLVVALAYLHFSFYGDEAMAFNIKPFLIPSLIIATYKALGLRHKNLLMLALFFCWAGDVLLLFTGVKDLYFILGLSAFLIGHLVYIVLFRQYSGPIKFRLLPFTLILIYIIVFLSYLSGHLGNLFMPVLLYALVIGAMLYFAIQASMHQLKANGFLLTSGAVAFVISDSILAINKFYSPVPNSDFLIMLT